MWLRGIADMRFYVHHAKTPPDPTKRDRTFIGSRSSLTPAVGTTRTKTQKSRTLGEFGVKVYQNNRGVTQP
jgi:hypothetical protein